MTLHEAIRNGWTLVAFDYEPEFALMERTRADGLRERALALKA